MSSSSTSGWSRTNPEIIDQITPPSSGGAVTLSRPEGVERNSSTAPTASSTSWVILAVRS